MVEIRAFLSFILWLRRNLTSAELTASLILCLISASSLALSSLAAFSVNVTTTIFEGSIFSFLSHISLTTR